MSIGNLREWVVYIYLINKYLSIFIVFNKLVLRSALVILSVIWPL